MKYVYFAWNPLKAFGEAVRDVLSGIGAMIYHALRPFFYFIISALFKLSSYLYQLFVTLCHGRLLDDSTLNIVATRVGAILGLVMLFYVTISFIQMLVNPDIIVDNDKGAVGVVKRVIIAIAMLGLAPFVFSTLFQIQSAVVDNDVISKIIFPVEVNTDNFGRVLSAELFLSGFRVDDSFFDSSGNISIVDDQGNPIDNQEILLCQQETYVLKDRIFNSNDYDVGTLCLNTTIDANVVDDAGNSIPTSKYIIDFQWLVLLFTSGFLVYYLFSYCIGVGMRMIQLAVLEIISPMAIISYISPKKDNMFSKWTKLYFATYIDVFIRIAVINFAVFLIATILDTDSGVGHFWNTISVDQKSFDGRFLKIIMIIALLSFAKKAPELIKELFPSSASHLGLGGFHVKDALGLGTALGVGAAVGTGAAVGLIGGGINGAVGGFRKNGFRGLWHGLTGAAGGLVSGGIHGIDNGFRHRGNVMRASGSMFREQMLRNTRSREAIEDGSTFGGRMIATLQHGLGVQTAGQRVDRNIEKLNSYSKGVSSIEEYADTGVAAVRDAKRRYEHLQASGASVAAIDAARAAWKRAQHGAIEDIINGTNYYVTASDGTGSARIRAQLDHLNRQYDENRALFNAAGVRKIGVGSTYDDLDSYNQNAGTYAIELDNSRETEVQRADDRYAYWEARERGGRVPPGTGRRGGH